MKQITRAVALEDVRDLLERVPHAHVAWHDGDRVSAIAVSFRFADEKYWIGVPPDTAPLGGAQAMLLIDEGWYYFDLRGLRVRGRVAPADVPPPGSSAALRWLALLPEKLIAWDYGTMRQKDGT